MKALGAVHHLVLCGAVVVLVPAQRLFRFQILTRMDVRISLVLVPLIPNLIPLSLSARTRVSNSIS
jgi:hypothetical protein